MNDYKGTGEGRQKGEAVKGVESQADNSNAACDADMAEQQRLSEMMDSLERNLTQTMSLEAK